MEAKEDKIPDLPYQIHVSDWRRKSMGAAARKQRRLLPCCRYFRTKYKSPWQLLSTRTKYSSGWCLRHPVNPYVIVTFFLAIPY